MSRQVMLSDRVVKQLYELKTMFGFESYSQTIEFLFSKLNIGRESIISEAFLRLERTINKYTRELELIELMRIVYIALTDERVKIYSNEVQKSLEEAKNALKRLHKSLKDSIEE